MTAGLNTHRGNASLPLEQSKAMREALPPAIDARCLSHPFGDLGCVSYYVDDSAGDTTPLLMLHSINAAPSAREMQPLFDHYRETHTVYAPDLPGFGRSERRNLDYSPELYAGFIEAFLSDIVGRPAHVIAFSLSAEFAARAILEAPDLVKSLTLISPTGFSTRQPPQGPGTDRVLRALKLPLFGDALYGMLTSRPSIRYFLGQAFDGETPQALIDYAYATAHQPGAKYAPFRFLGMKLFTKNAFNALYLQLQHPVLVIHDRDPNISFERVDDIVDRPNWQREKVQPTRGLPHWERPFETINALDRFWSGVESSA